MNIPFAMVAVFVFSSPNMMAGHGEVPNILTIASERWDGLVCDEKIEELEGARSALKEMTSAKDQVGTWTTADEDQLTITKNDVDAMEYDLEQHC